MAGVGYAQKTFVLLKKEQVGRGFYHFPGPELEIFSCQAQILQFPHLERKEQLLKERAQEVAIKYFPPSFHQVRKLRSQQPSPVQTACAWEARQNWDCLKESMPKQREEAFQGKRLRSSEPGNVGRHCHLLWDRDLPAEGN